MLKVTIISHNNNVFKTFALISSVIFAAADVNCRLLSVNIHAPGTRAYVLNHCTGLLVSSGSYMSVLLSHHC